MIAFEHDRQHLSGGVLAGFVHLPVHARQRELRERRPDGKHRVLQVGLNAAAGRLSGRLALSLYARRARSKPHEDQRACADGERPPSRRFAGVTSAVRNRIVHDLLVHRSVADQ
jgi:hypothetical protein